MNPGEVQRFSLIHGASWLTRDGEILPVPSFHEEWIREHEELAAGARNVCELILRKGWISVALYSEGYLELMVPTKRDRAVRDLVAELLTRNKSTWSKALVMSMDEEGYAMLMPSDLETGQLDQRLEETI